MTRVTVWNENRHEKINPKVAEQNIQEAIGDNLRLEMERSRREGAAVGR